MFDFRIIFPELSAEITFHTVMHRFNPEPTLQQKVPGARVQ